MPATPTDILEIHRPDVTVRLGWRGTPAFRDMNEMFQAGPSADAVMNGLSGVEHDPAQILKLQHFLSPAHGGGLPNMTVRYDGSHHVPHPVLRMVRHHLDAGRLQGFVAARHIRPEHRRPHGLSTPTTPYVPPPSTPIPAPSPAHAAAVASALPATAAERVAALFEAAVPFMKADIGAEIRHLLTVHGLADAARATVGFMLIMTAAQAVPIFGVTLDAVLVGLIMAYAGFSGLRAFKQLIVLSSKAARAGSKAEIERLAPEAARAIETLGTDFLIAFGTRFKGRRPDSAGGAPAGSAAPADAVPAAREATGTSAYPGAVMGASPAPTEAGEASAAAEQGTGGPGGGSAGENCDGAVCASDPVNVATGAVFAHQVDFLLPGPLPLEFSRLWISTSTINGDLGHGWSHSLDMALLPRPGGRIALRLPDGRFVAMDEPAAGRPSIDVVEGMQLVLRGDETVAVDMAGRTYRFGAPLGPARMRRLEEVADGNGNAIRIERDHRGGLVSATDSAGRILTFDRDELGRIVRIEGPSLDGEGRLTLASFGYDRHGDLVTALDAVGGGRRFRYDRHLLTRQERVDGLTFNWRWNDTALRRRARCIHTWGDGNILERRFDYDDAGRLTTVRSPRGGVVVHEWNAQGRVTATVDALGRRSTRTFGPDGKLLLAETRADGATRSLEYDDYGRVTASTDYDGAVTRRTYGPPDDVGLVLDLPVRVEAPDGAASSFGWDARGNLASHTDASGRTRRFIRDERGLTLAILDKLGTLRRFGWSEAGQMAWEAEGETGAPIRYRHDALGRLVERRDGADLPVRYRPDAAGRLTGITRGDGGKIEIEYDRAGNLVRNRDATGREVRWRYDGLPYPSERIDPDGTRLRYRYDLDLHLVELVNQKNERYALSFDPAGQLVAETGFDGRRLSFRYDDAGMLVGHSDAEERGATYRRDRLGRLLQRTDSDGSSRLFGYDPTGRMVLASDDSAELRFSYTPDGALFEESGPAGVIRHAYDARGRRTGTTLPDGRTIRIVRDDTGRMSSMTFDGRPVATIERDGLGREIGRRAGSLRLESAYDPQGRLVRQIGRMDDVVAEPTADRRYAWDAADRLTEMVDLDRGTRRYAYDKRARLVGVDGDLPERFTFDPASNLVGSSGDNGAASPGLAVGDRLLMRGDRKFEYDGCGNRVRELRGARGNVERFYRYRADNRLVEVEERSRLGRRVTSFRYDALGRRTEKRSQTWGPQAANDGGIDAPASDIVTAFVWNGDVLLAEGRPDDPYATVYLHEPESFRPLAQARRAPDEALSIRHYQFDHIGTPVAMTNDDGTTVWRGRARAWGGAATTLAHEGELQPIAFQGQYRDAETGLHYNRFRFYAPDEGCYVQPDPLGFIGGVNLAAYGSNPVLEVDPFGLAGDPATATHITYVGVDAATGKPYVGYASMQGVQNPQDVLRYRYSGNFDRFGGTPPNVIYSGYGQAGKDTARGLEQDEFENLGGLDGTANKQNPVGAGNARRDIYSKAAADYRSQQADPTDARVC